MITKLYLENFRCILKEQIELGKITLLTGPNNSGKSTIVYGLLALKNIVLNSNQSLDSALGLGFINLGGFGQTVHMKNETANMRLGVDVEKDGFASRYSVLLGKSRSELCLSASKPLAVELKLDITFPYAANKSTGSEASASFGKVKISWNGIAPTINVEQVASATEDEVANGSRNVSSTLNAPVEDLRAVDFIPLRRGFVKPMYSSVPMQQQLLTEDELATALATDRDLEGRVAHYLQMIVPRFFSVRPIIGTANFALQARDQSTGLVCDLVNEGFGTNQLVTILTKALRKETQTVCIEEPEIHLHPGGATKLVDVLVGISREENKSFVISTHSEHVVTSLLASVAQKRMRAEDVRVYYLTKEGKKTKVEKQDVNQDGQIRGGLKAFYEAELSSMRDFYRVSEEK